MSLTLIVPIAADNNSDKENIPYLFLPDNNGIILCVKSIFGLNYTDFDRIIFTILEKHDKQYYLVDTLNTQFKRLGLNNVEIIKLKRPTKNQAETIFQTIQQAKIEGSIFIKDADSYFNGIIYADNLISTASLEDLQIVDPRNKSYVTIDEMCYVTNIIEKRINSKFFSAGGYCLKDVNDFCRYFNILSHYNNLYISHIIYSMLLDKLTFKPLFIDNYIDWGTFELRKLYLSKTYAEN